MYVSENQCALKVDDIYITSRLVTGTFPDYEQIIPKEYKTNVTLLTKDLAQALKKTNIFLNKFMQLTLTISGGTFTLFRHRVASLEQLQSRYQQVLKEKILYLILISDIYTRQCPI